MQPRPPELKIGACPASSAGTALGTVACREGLLRHAVAEGKNGAARLRLALHSNVFPAGMCFNLFRLVLWRSVREPFESENLWLPDPSHVVLGLSFVSGLIPSWRRVRCFRILASDGGGVVHSILALLTSAAWNSSAHWHYYTFT